MTIVCSTFGMARAQNYLTEIGAPTFTTAQPVELGFINLSNGNLHLGIPIAGSPQRGSRPFVAELVYDSRIWQTVPGSSTSWQPTNVSNSQGGWRFITSADAGSVASSSSLTKCQSPTYPYPLLTWYVDYGPFQWTSPDGTTHVFPITTQVYVNTACPFISSWSTGDTFANDSSGFHMYVTNYNSVSAVYAPGGTQVYPSVKDTNGNYFSKDANGNVIDTLNRKPVTVTTNCNGNSSQTCYDVLNSQGSTSRFTVTTTTVSVNTAFGQSGVTEYSGSFTAIQSITLPDNTSYTFSYDSGTTSGHYGLLTGITLPTTGQVTYGYTNFADSFGSKNRWVYSRTSGGGTWTFIQNVITTCGSGSVGCQQKVTVTKPSNDNTVYVFTLNNGAWKSQVDAYSGAVSPTNLLATSISTWDFSQSCSPTPCTGASKIRILRTTTMFATPGGNDVTNKTEMTYADTNTSNIASFKNWKFYAGSSPTFPATPDRETDLTYLATSAYTAKNIVNRVLSTTVKDGGGSTVAQTNFSYDGGSLTSVTGATQHDDTNFGTGNTTRGNLTQIQRCTNIAACSSNFVQTAMTYDTTGQVLSVQDPKGNSTGFSYTDNFFTDNGTNPPASYPPAAPTNAYLTSVTPPIIGAATVGYYFNTGKRASSKDQNNADSYVHFLDSLDRLTHVYGPTLTIPNTSTQARPWALAVFPLNSETQVDTYVSIDDASPSSGCSTCRHDRALLDNWGRVTIQELMSDPEGFTSITTNYDLTGRVLNVSHPYRSISDPTYGLETPTYDGLNRITKVTHQDTSYSQVLFGAAVSGTGAQLTQLCTPTATYGLGYPILFIDEANKKRELWSDGFGRTIEADEPDSSGNLTSNTCYRYDSLANLTQIVHGSQTRSYAYDALSRVTSAAIPELADASGNHCQVTYTYDNNSNVLTRTSPAPNQTTCTSTVTATLSYDALNRLTGKTYSDATPSVSFFYDQTTYNGLTITNGKGRLTGMSDAPGTTAWSYDAAGNIVTERRTIAGITKTISYSYNLDGSIATVTYPSGKQVTYTVSNAQRLTSAKDLASGTQFAITASYAPPGGLQSVITGQISGGFGGVTKSHTYNNRLEYTSTQATSSAGTALNLSLGYNLPGGNNGSVASITNNVDTGRTQNFAYDPLNRILTAQSSATSGADCWGQNFGLDGNAADDPLANLTAINSGTQTPQACPLGNLSVTVDGNNHINSNTSFAYDAAGNMPKDGSGLTYVFDAENRITSAAGVTYTYDGNGLRVEKSSGTLYWRSIFGDALAESDLSGNITTEYVFFAGRRIARRDASGNVFYYFADALGTTRTITQSNGTVCYDADFTPYGQEIVHTNTCPQNYKFTGYERDPETGLDYAFARYYSSRLGRFLSTDPLGGAVGDPQSHNAYAYVLNSPTNLIDPLGLDPSGQCPNNPHIPPGTVCGPPPGVQTGPDCAGESYLCELGLNCNIDGAPAPCSMAFGLLMADAAALASLWGWRCAEVPGTIGEVCGNTGLMIQFGGPGGAGPGPRNQPYYVKLKVLNDCLASLPIPVNVAALKESAPGGYGYAIGIGPDHFTRSGATVPIVVSNDAATYNNAQLSQLCGRSAVGCTLGNPYVNYAMNNNTAFGTILTQLHEFAHSFFAITAGSGLIPEPGGEIGKALEDCVRHHGGIGRR